MKKSAVLSLPKITADFRNFVAKTDEKQKTKDEMNRTFINFFRNECKSDLNFLIAMTKIFQMLTSISGTIV